MGVPFNVTLGAGRGGEEGVGGWTREACVGVEMQGEEWEGRRKTKMMMEGEE